MSDITGQRLGRYLIEEKLGEGGMATVYRATDERLGRSVAVKVIRVDLFPTAALEGMLKRFDREARALASLTHANIVGVIDYGEMDGSPYLVMEYLPGGSLKDRMGAPISFNQAARIMAVIAGALDYAHVRGIVHRDVKPSNILLTASGDPMLSDFGIAKLLDVTESSMALTGSGMAIGTPEYMAPEQWMGKTSPASDQYSLGTILYELVTGRKPYTAATPGELLVKQATQPVTPPHEFIRDLPGASEQVILRALAREPEQRYPSMRAFAAALEETALLDQSRGGSQAQNQVQAPPRPVDAPPPSVEDDIFSRTPLPPQRPPVQKTPPSVADAAAVRAASSPPPQRQPEPGQGTPPGAQSPSGRTPAPRTPPPPDTSAKPVTAQSQGQSVRAAGIPPASGTGYAASPTSGSSASGSPVASTPAAGPLTPAPVSARRSATPWLLGGLAALVLVVGVFVVGVIFLAGRGLLARRGGTPVPTPAGITAATATQVKGQASKLEPTPTDATAVSGVSTGTLRVSLEGSPGTLDPQMGSFVEDIAHLNLIYEGLTRLDEKMATAPGAAERWEYSDDLLKLTFYLRKNLQYSDGSLLNAKRFEYSLLRNLSPDLGGDYSSITDEITGAAAYRGADSSSTGAAGLEKLRAAVGVHALDSSGKPCTGYDQPDCLVLQISFSRPAAYFHTIMALWPTYPAKEELIEEGGEDWWSDPANQVGNGPMVLSEYEADSHSLFEPNRHYWRGAARVSIDFQYLTEPTEVLKAYRDGELDIVPVAGDDIALVREGEDLSSQLLIYPGACTYSFDFHQQKEPFNDRAVREALSYAFDREGLVKEVMQGYASPTLTWVPKDTPGYDAGETRFAYNPGMAKKLLEAARYKIVNGQLTKGGKTYPITLTYSDTERNRARHEYIAAKWKADLGLQVKLEPLDSDALSSRFDSLETTPQTAIHGWCADYPDPHNWLSLYWTSGSAFTERIGFRDVELDRLLEQADRQKDSAKRMALYAEAQKKLVGDVPGIFMWNSINMYLVKPSVKGIRTTPLDSSWPGSFDPLSITIQN